MSSVSDGLEETALRAVEPSLRSGASVQAQRSCPSMADAILDRLVHGAIHFDLHGTSMRSEDAGAGAKQ